MIESRFRAHAEEHDYELAMCCLKLVGRSQELRQEAMKQLRGDFCQYANPDETLMFTEALKAMEGEQRVCTSRVFAAEEREHFLSEIHLVAETARRAAQLAADASSPEDASLRPHQCAARDRVSARLAGLATNELERIIGHVVDRYHPVMQEQHEPAQHPEVPSAPRDH